MYRLKAFDLIERINRLTTAELVLDSLVSTFRPFGFDFIILTGLDPAKKMDTELLASRWPPDLLTFFGTRDGLRFSPVARLARLSVAPFFWSEETWINDPDPRAREVMRVAAEFGIREGYVIPARGPRGLEMAISLGGGKIEVPVRTAPMIYLVAMYGFMRLCKLVDMQTCPDAELTPREQNVLSCSARGMSALDTASALGIAKRTVDQYVQTACRKLGAHTRTQAVAIALRDHLIEP